jgi:hypothetical protein
MPRTYVGALALVSPDENCAAEVVRKRGDVLRDLERCRRVGCVVLALEVEGRVLPRDSQQLAALVDVKGCQSIG